MLQVVNDRLSGSDKAACRRQRLAKGAHDYIHVFERALLLSYPRAGRTKETESMGFVDISPCSIEICERCKGLQVGHVAFHAEDAFGYDERALVALLQASFQVLKVIMAKPDTACLGAQSSIHQAGMEVVFAQNYLS